jgi:hypothetical protein
MCVYPFLFFKAVLCAGCLLTRCCCHGYAPARLCLTLLIQVFLLVSIFLVLLGERKLVDQEFLLLPLLTKAFRSEFANLCSWNLDIF